MSNSINTNAMNASANTVPVSAEKVDIFNALITAEFSYKKKVDGTMTVVTTTLKQDNYNHLPKASEVPDTAKAAFNALNDAFMWNDRAMTTSDTTEANKYIVKSQNYLKKYLTAVDLNTDTLNVSALTEIFGAKRQKSKGEYKAGGTSKTTFIKYVLYLTEYFKDHNSWKTPAPVKGTKTVSTNTFSLDEFKEILISFGLSETAVLKQVQQIKAAREQAAAAVKVSA